MGGTTRGHSDLVWCFLQWWRWYLSAFTDSWAPIPVRDIDGAIHNLFEHPKLRGQAPTQMVAVKTLVGTLFKR